MVFGMAPGFCSRFAVRTKQFHPRKQEVVGWLFEGGRAFGRVRGRRELRGWDRTEFGHVPV